MVTTKQVLKLNETRSALAGVAYYANQKALTFGVQGVTGQVAITCASLINTMIYDGVLDPEILYSVDFDLKRALILSNLDKVKDERTALKIGRGDISTNIIRKVLGDHYVTYEFINKMVDAINKKVLNNEVSDPFEA